MCVNFFLFKSSTRKFITPLPVQKLIAALIDRDIIRTYETRMIRNQIIFTKYFFLDNIHHLHVLIFLSFLPSFLPSLFLTSCAIPSTSFGEERLIAQPLHQTVS